MGSSSTNSRHYAEDENGQFEEARSRLEWPVKRVWSKIAKPGISFFLIWKKKFCVSGSKFAGYVTTS